MKIVYFDVYGRGEPIRMLLTHAKVAFEDERLTFEEFKTQKEAGKFENGQLPVVFMDDGTQLTQSKALLWLFGKKHGYVPDDAMELYHGQAVVDAWQMDFADKLQSVIGPTPADKVVDVYGEWCKD
mgnify:CR=1 FL=1|tara:strand:+ start:79 stop:456 length:378 start_codon:yes stop_codon:yes gene_type:complete